MESGPTPEEVREERASRTFYRYVFFKVAREFRALDEKTRAELGEEFVEKLEGPNPGVSVITYSLLATRADADFMLWVIASDLEDVQTFVAGLLKTGFGRYLEVSYSFLAMSKRSRYVGKHRHPGQEGASDERKHGDTKYAFVYPMVKKREWYRVSFEERQRMMADHFRTGHKYPSIRINTGYSFGLDDQEFVVSFEGDSPAEFLDLVEELRTSDASKYTERETPIFTCMSVDPRTMVGLFG